MPKSFTEGEKNTIRTQLITQCKKSWATHGYKKTSIAALCAAVGISTGAFYLFYGTKEALFCDTMDDFQKGTRRMFDAMLSSPPTKAEVCNALKKLYQEYAKNNIITKRHNPDYQHLLSKLPPDWLAQHRQNSKDNLANTLFAPGVKLKMSQDKAHRVIDTLLLTVANKENHPDHYEIFCLLLDCAIHEIYE